MYGDILMEPVYFHGSVHTLRRRTATDAICRTNRARFSVRHFV